jgi:hypothetical protein
MLWVGRVYVVLAKTMREFRRGNITPDMVENIVWWIMVGQSEDEYA